MVNNVNYLNLEKINASAKPHGHFHVNEHLFIAMDGKGLGGHLIVANQPYHVEEGRMMCVTKGNALCSINLERHELTQNNAVVVRPNSTFEILEHSPDLDFMACSFQPTLPMVAKISNHIVVTLHDDDMQLMTAYFRLLWLEAKRPTVEKDIVDHLQKAMLLHIGRGRKARAGGKNAGTSKDDALLHRFIGLVNQHGAKHRHINFYAGQLCLTPNYLGAVVKQASGFTVMQWINRFVVQQAKMMLKYTDLPVWEIAEQLSFANPSFFSKYFKRETNLSPNEYRRR